LIERPPSLAGRYADATLEERFDVIASDNPDAE
jgi:hypothetical protein